MDQLGRLLETYPRFATPLLSIISVRPLIFFRQFSRRQVVTEYHNFRGIFASDRYGILQEELEGNSHVEEVTNFFVQGQRWGGAGGLGLPQVERSLEAYQKYERAATHFLVIQPSYERQAVVDYYDFQAEKVVHTSLSSADPTWGRWGLLLGSYRSVKGEVVDGKLLLAREYLINVTSILIILLALALAVVIYLVGVRPLINRGVFGHRPPGHNRVPLGRLVEPTAGALFCKDSASYCHDPLFIARPTTWGIRKTKLRITKSGTTFWKKL